MATNTVAMMSRPPMNSASMIQSFITGTAAGRHRRDGRHARARYDIRTSSFAAAAMRAASGM